MKLGFHSAILPDLQLDAIMWIAAEIGYSCVEVMCWPPSKAERRYAGVTHIDLTEFNDILMATILDTVQASGVAISALGYYPNCLAADDAESQMAVAHLCRRIEAAPKLGLNTVNTTPKLPGLGEVDWGAFFSTLRDIEFNGCVCVEVEDRSYEGSLELRKESLRQSYRYLRQFMPAKI